jgi:phage repressor protein C with HTH and peptisase S24 domain
MLSIGENLLACRIGPTKFVGMPDKIRELVQAKLTEKGLEMGAVSKQIGKNHAYLYQYLKKGTPASLAEGVREALAPILGLEPRDLRDGAALPSMIARKPTPGQLDTAEKIPVLGLGEGSEDGWELWNGDVVEYTQRPTILAGVPGAYAVYATGTSMEPRYHPFEMLYIHPRKPVQIGDYVLVERHPKVEGDGPRAIIKRLAKRSGDRVTLEQFSPPKKFDVKTADIKAMHRIVGSSDA